MSRHNYDPNSPHQHPIDGGFSANHQNEVPGDQPQAPRRRWLWILFGVFGLGTMGLVVCCGVGAIFFSRISTTLLEPTRTELNQLTQVQSQCGEIKEVSMNFAGTLKEAEDHQDFVILDADTEAGPFQFSVKMNADGSIDQAFLIPEDGSREQLDLSSRGLGKPIDSGQESEIPNTNRPGPTSENLDAVDETERELKRIESELNLD